MTAGTGLIDEPGRLRHALVRTLIDAGWLTDPAVVAALETVPRHVFVLQVPVQQAYANDVVHTKLDADGRPISAASQPRIVAMMLQQAAIRAGDRVLEIGAGTGYNAALVAALAGLTGQVTTVDVDADIVDAAAEHLKAAGYGSVRVVCGDGALGYPPGAPFDVVIATVGAWDLPACWLEQVAVGGRLVVPQRIRGGMTRSVVYQRSSGGGWVSVDSQMCGFMPLRGGAAADPHGSLDLSGDGLVRIDVYQDQHIDGEALAGVLDTPRVQLRTGVRFGGQDSLEWLWLWLACALPGGLSALQTDQTPRDEGLVLAPYRVWTMATTRRGALAYVTLLPPVDDGDGRGTEVAVVGHGPGGDLLAEQVAAEVVRWDRQYRDQLVWFAVGPAGTAIGTDHDTAGSFVFAMPSGRLKVRWSDAAD
ncbi:methyltransferase, FxLD system [Dactylosporangium salmoneum]|uniref:Protein-L-isoaspartate O-methyltransferase n=1 Tax=Dactylosporangium salmoneum TaxID=53361 RepID=A0ABP5SK23_9ACTN